ncbi:MAG: DUF748 domain-containing protein [Candidatus Rokubacteria bacterium]|nr:DUF748 domain-containing protein [Candidatus Rokubacteria bacterium]MBI3105774.1 DUF748 domain-containing protein [Candidatus Rokubacteria bacterium]
MSMRWQVPQRLARWVRRPPKGLLWVGGIGGALVLLAYTVAYLTDEPLRRHVEREVNGRLTGYTVRIPRLSLHPLSASFDLQDATIVQDANPDPPIARIHRLNMSLDWRALFDGRVVADITFDRPTLYLDLAHVKTEAEGTVALKDRGWQGALEAVALDLKINQLRVVNGDVTYVDKGPFQPLRLSQLNGSAQNIRNIRSKERVYPSEVSLEGTVFDTGRLAVNGHADFLAEPHPGILARFRIERVALGYFKPITNRYNLSVRKGTLTVAGTAEYAPTMKAMTLDRVLVQGLDTDYVHTPQTAAVEKARAQRAADAAKSVANDPGVQLRIDRVDIARSRVAIVNRAATPPFRLLLTDADLSVQNLSNQKADGTATVQLRGKFMGTGDTQMSATFRPETRSADVAVKVQVDGTDMVSMNDLVHAYGGFGVAAGTFSVFAELRAKDGGIDGYVKPLFRGVQVAGGRRDQPESFRQRLYEGLVGIVTKLLENRPRGEVATVVTLSGPMDRPEVSTWEVVGRLLQNAFFKAILPGFEPGAHPQAAGGSRAGRERQGPPRGQGQPGGRNLDGDPARDAGTVPAPPPGAEPAKPESR